MRKNPITSTIDFDQDGIQHGFLRLPYSRNDSAWGSIMIPITQFKNGQGPTAILTGANHGDEYEGTIALFKLAERNNIDDINGRVIIIPAMNYPAFEVNSRTSPIDSGNLNRLFPGKPDGTITQIIADYFTRTLLPMADYVLDIHSGGKTLAFVPLAAYHVLDDKILQAKAKAAAQAFSAPYTLEMLEIDAYGMYDTEAEQKGKVFVTTELAGGGTTSPYTIEIACHGVDNFLIHAGILNAHLNPCPQPTKILNMPDDSSFVFCEYTGLLEPKVVLGESVFKGQILALIHHTQRTAMPPVQYTAPKKGIIMAHHFPSSIKRGDTLYVIAEESKQ